VAALTTIWFGCANACSRAARLRGSSRSNQMVGFSSLVAAQLFYAFACRSRCAAIFAARPLPPNPYLLGALGVSFAAQAAALFVPGLRNLFGPSLGITEFGIFVGRRRGPAAGDRGDTDDAGAGWLIDIASAGAVGRSVLPGRIRRRVISWCVISRRVIPRRRVIGRPVIAVVRRRRTREQPERCGDNRRGADDDGAGYAERPSERKRRAGGIIRGIILRLGGRER
jgi:hypothetical protein